MDKKTTIGMEADAKDTGGRGSLRWPVRILGPAPRLKEIHLACWALLAAFVIVRFGVPLWVQLKTGTDMLHILPADFIYFYGIGRIVHEHSLAQLYDYPLQLRVFNEIFPLQDGAYGPSPYPPFVALFFSLLARLPFSIAFMAWSCISFALYLIGVLAATGELFASEPLKRSIAVCAALGFYPFLIGTLINGQLAAIAVCAIGVAIAAERAERPMASGLALSLLLYKPTLLLLIVPMHLLTRRFKSLAGFAAGAAILVLIATAFGGVSVWPAYARFAGLFGRVASLSDRSGLPLWKFIDLGSSLQAIAGGRSAIATILAIAISVVVGAVLVWLWWISAKAARPTQELVWAATLSWTLLINIYVPIYDAVLVVVAVAMTIAALEGLHWAGAIGWIVLLAVLIEAASWMTSDFAVRYRIQLLSLAIAILGSVQLVLLYRANRVRAIHGAGPR